MIITSGFNSKRRINDTGRAAIAGPAPEHTCIQAGRSGYSVALAATTYFG